LRVQFPDLTGFPINFPYLEKPTTLLNQKGKQELRNIKDVVQWKSDGVRFYIIKMILRWGENFQTDIVAKKSGVNI